MSGKTNIFIMFFRGSIEVMDDRSWMYRDSPQGLRMMDYYNSVQGFNDVVTMHLLTKGFMEDYLCWYAYGELFIRNESMVEKMVGSTSNARNVHGVVYDNNNPYMNMVMDAMRMNQGNVSQCPIIEEESNANATRFFDLLKDSDEPLWDGYKNHSKLSVIA